MKFQELVARAAKFLGDLGTLATKNVQRNPVRAASMEVREGGVQTKNRGSHIPNIKLNTNFDCR
jgi:hypothetical protein